MFIVWLVRLDTVDTTTNGFKGYCSGSTENTILTHAHTTSKKYKVHKTPLTRPFQLQFQRLHALALLATI